MKRITWLSLGLLLGSTGCNLTVTLPQINQNTTGTQSASGTANCTVTPLAGVTVVSGTPVVLSVDVGSANFETTLTPPLKVQGLDAAFDVETFTITRTYTADSTSMNGATSQTQNDSIVITDAKGGSLTCNFSVTVTNTGGGTGLCESAEGVDASGGFQSYKNGSCTVQAPGVTVTASAASADASSTITLTAASAGFNGTVTYAFSTTEPGVGGQYNGNTATVVATDGQAHAGFSVLVSATDGTSTAQTTIQLAFTTAAPPPLTCTVQLQQSSSLPDAVTITADVPADAYAYWQPCIVYYDLRAPGYEEANQSPICVSELVVSEDVYAGFAIALAVTDWYGSQLAICTNNWQLTVPVPGIQPMYGTVAK